MICYKCGQEVGNAKRCPNGGADLSVFLKVIDLLRDRRSGRCLK